MKESKRSILVPYDAGSLLSKASVKMSSLNHSKSMRPPRFCERNRFPRMKDTTTIIKILESTSRNGNSSLAEVRVGRGPTGENLCHQLFVGVVSYRAVANAIDWHWAAFES
jgi:hypothetical protein